MAEPADSATTLLSATADSIREVYHKKPIWETYSRFGTVTDRVLKPGKTRKLEGDGITVQVRSGNMDSAVGDRNVFGAFPKPRAHETSKIKVRFSENAEANDFFSLRSAIRCSHIDLDRAINENVAAEDFATQLVTQQMKDLREQVAIRRNIPVSSKLGTVAGTPKQDDADTFASASATPAANSGVRFQVDGDTSIAYFQRNRRLEVVDGDSGASNGHIIVNRYNPRDFSVGAEAFVSDERSPGTSPGTSLIDNNDELFLAGSRDVGLISIGEWFKNPVSGEDFMGKDRTLAANHWLRPTKTGPSTATTFKMEHLDDFAISMGFVVEDPSAKYVTQCSPQLHQKFRNIVGDNILVQWSASDPKRDLFAVHGFDGMVYHHPTIGKIMLNADALCPANRIRFLKLGTWEMMKYHAGEFKVMDGDDGRPGGFYRMGSGTSDGSKGHFYQMDVLAYFVDFCLAPRENGEIENITATGVGLGGMAA
jgi:hypothetical protein